jgi:HEPN domain-containing protein
VLLEDLLFEAQQAAKAIKAMFVPRDMEHLKVHDLGRLLLLLGHSGVSIPPNIQRASQLTVYAVQTRYPEEAENSVTVDEYTAAVSIAEAVVAWAQNLVQTEFRMKGRPEDR